MLSTFRPTQPNGEYLEQNLITNFAIAFVQNFTNAKVYTEIPFISNINKGFWQNRLDLYIDNGDIGYIIEAKGSQQNDKLFSLIDDDIARIKSIEMKKSFESMAKTKIPNKIIGIIIADCWSGKNKEFSNQEQKWINYKTELINFKNIINLDTTFSNEIRLDKSDYKYYILTGILKYPIWSING
jgi:hypothetical protein